MKIFLQGKRCNYCRTIGHFPFCERPFALHRQQTEKDKQNVDFDPPGKISADAHVFNHTPC